MKMRRTVSVEKLGHDPYFSDQENILLWAAVVEKKTLFVGLHNEN